jgi:hypothetical protein
LNGTAGKISDSYATGAVDSILFMGSYAYGGGLVGNNLGQITSSYAVG